MEPVLLSESVSLHVVIHVINYEDVNTLFFFYLWHALWDMVSTESEGRCKHPCLDKRRKSTYFITDTPVIAPDKALFHLKNADIFLVPP